MDRGSEETTADWNCEWEILAKESTGTSSTTRQQKVLFMNSCCMSIDVGSVKQEFSDLWKTLPPSRRNSPKHTRQSAIKELSVRSSTETTTTHFAALDIAIQYFPKSLYEPKSIEQQPRLTISEENSCRGAAWTPQEFLSLTLLLFLSDDFRYADVSSSRTESHGFA